MSSKPSKMNPIYCKSPTPTFNQAKLRSLFRRVSAIFPISLVFSGPSGTSGTSMPVQKNKIPLLGFETLVMQHDFSLTGKVATLQFQSIGRLGTPNLFYLGVDCISLGLKHKISQGRNELRKRCGVKLYLLVRIPMPPAFFFSFIFLF